MQRIEQNERVQGFEQRGRHALWRDMRNPTVDDTMSDGVERARCRGSSKRIATGFRALRRSPTLRRGHSANFKPVASRAPKCGGEILDLAF